MAQSRSPRTRLKTRIRQADFVAVSKCPGCGGGMIVMMDADQNVFAQAHFPEGEDWLETEFIPSLREAMQVPATRH